LATRLFEAVAAPVDDDEGGGHVCGLEGGGQLALRDVAEE
jgi:hypothetical protein